MGDNFYSRIVNKKNRKNKEEHVKDMKRYEEAFEELIFN